MLYRFPSSRFIFIFLFLELSPAIFVHWLQIPIMQLLQFG